MNARSNEANDHLPTCDWCGRVITEGIGEITCERNPGEAEVFDTEACLDEHIKHEHANRPLADRPDLRPLGRKVSR